MAWSYEKLWIQLIKRKWKRTSLKTYAGISSSALAHMGKDEPVTMDVLGKICAALQCNIGDIVDFIPDEDDSNRISAPVQENPDDDAILDLSNFPESTVPFEVVYIPSQGSSDE